MYGARHGFPCEASPVAVQLQSVCKVFCFLSRSYKLNNGKELLMSIKFLLLLQHQHEVMVEAGLHHDPVHCAGQVDVRRQEHNVFSL